MIAIPRGAVVRASALGLQPADPTLNAEGLEGTVVRCAETPYLCKIYTRPRTVAESAAIQRLVDLREWMEDASDRRILDGMFSWPAHRVVADDPGMTTIGVLIPPAEPRFWFPYQNRWHLLDGQHVTRAESIAGDFSASERVHFLLDLVVAWDLLDRHGLVYGDANSRNLLFSTAGYPHVFVLDCDGIRPEGDPTLEPRRQANWYDPYAAGTASRDSDRFLLSLWVLRVLVGSMVRPEDAAAAAGSLRVPGAPRLRDLLVRGLSAPADRPAPGEYLAPLFGHARKCA